LISLLLQYGCTARDDRQLHQPQWRRLTELAAGSMPPAVIEKVIAKVKAGETVPDSAVAKMVADIKERTREDSRLSPRLNPIARAWMKATKRQQRDFALKFRSDVVRAQQQHDLAERRALSRPEARSAAATAPDDGLDIPECLRRVAP
jgi:hypothetical protein